MKTGANILSSEHGNSPLIGSAQENLCSCVVDSHLQIFRLKRTWRDVRLGPPRQSTKRGPPHQWKAQGMLVLSMYLTNYSKSLTRASILSGASSTSVLGGEFIASQRDHNRATFNFSISTHPSYFQRPPNHLEALRYWGV